MKVVSAKQMTRIESLAYHDGASEVDFMEEAGSGVALVVHEYSEEHNSDKLIHLLCGKGNNAGDAYVAGVYLLHLDYIVTAFQLFPIEECSLLCRQNYERFINEGGRVYTSSNIEELPFPHAGIIVDGIFGTGFRGDVEEPIASIIRAANQTHLPIIAVDIPSGLNGETGEASEDTIIATNTAFLGLPKTGFFLEDGWNHVGTLYHIDFGLKKDYIDAAEADLTMLSPDMLLPLMPPIIRNRHKYQTGQVIGLAGSPSMPGAALLSSLAALKGGAGIVRLLHPEGMQPLLSASPYELIKVPYSSNDLDMIVEIMNRAAATFIGPGMGLTPETRHLIKEVLPRLEKPCVIDADALTVIAEEEIALPKQTILTPHTGELNRLLHIDSHLLDKEFLLRCQAYAANKEVTLILKGGPTFIFHKDQEIVVNPRGDPGMATAGSGDVLTGLLASLLAQGLSTQNAAALGVYLHAVAGEQAAYELTSYCMTASDIILYFPDAFDPLKW
jgi:hydroxyethylthiazole kinase-like uncharacterized protein yjeF